MAFTTATLIIFVIYFNRISSGSPDHVASIILKRNISSYFQEEGIRDVMEALRGEVHRSLCLDIALEYEGKVLNFKGPHVVLRLSSIQTSEWKELVSSPLFRHTCITLFMLDIPPKDEFDKLSLLQRKGSMLYFMIGSTNEEQSMTVLSDPDLGKEQNVALVNREATSNSWVIRTRQIYSPAGFLSTIISNKWRSSTGFSRDQELFPEQMENFYGYTLICSTLNFLPFVDYEKTPGSLYVKPKPSLDFFMLALIAEKLNFTYKVKMPEDGKWGIQKPNGEWMGVVGELTKDRANFGLVITLTIKRIDYIDFSIVYYFDPLTFVTGKIRQDSQWQKMIVPFQGEVWAVLVITFFICCVIYLPFIKVKTDIVEAVKINISRSILQIFGSLVSQSLAYLPKRMSGRIFIGFWLIFSIVITTYYKTSFKAMLIVPAVPQRIETLQQLLDSGLDFGTVAASGIEYSYLASSTSEVHQKIFKRLNLLPHTESMGMVNKGKYAYIYFESNIQDTITRKFTDPSGHSNIQWGREVIFSSRHTWGLPKGAPYGRTFNKAIRKCLEYGFQIHWIRELNRINKKDVNTGSAESEDESKNVVFSLDHLKGAFATLLIGYILSLVFFLGEVFTHKCLGSPFSIFWKK